MRCRKERERKKEEEKKEVSNKGEERGEINK